MVQSAMKTKKNERERGKKSGGRDEIVKYLFDHRVYIVLE